MRKILTLLFICICQPVFANNLNDSTKLFDWAESNYPQYFSPAKQPTTPISGLLARYYPDTQNYLATSHDYDVYAYSSSTGGLLSLGKMSNYVTVSEQAYINGQIYTVNESQPWVEAMLIREGKIIAIGDNQVIQVQVSDNTETIDLDNAMVLPGLHDVHLHPLEAGSKSFQFTLDTEETNPNNYIFDIETALVQNPDSTWLLGWGFELHTLLDGVDREPIKILDELSSTRPIAIMEQTSHAMWVNSKALAVANIDVNSPNPVGGVIMKGEDGQPNGLLIDNAGNLIVDLIVASIPDSEQNDYEGLINVALPTLAENGITSVCDARTYWKRNHHLTWQRVENENKLTVRANLGLWLYPTEDDATQIAKLKSLYANDPRRLLKINQIKLYADGVVLNTTAAMQTDYLINLLDIEPNNGVNYVSQNRIAKYIAELEPTGFDFHIHTIGNRGVNEALNAIEQSGSAKGRHRLTHVEYVNPADYVRFKQLNATADAQVAGNFAQPSHWHESDSLIGAELNQAVIPIKSLLEAGARVVLSSDWDVSDVNPFIGIQNAVTRDPQAISLSEAIKAYTINAAYVMRQEHLVGSLEVGKEADFIIIDRNIFNIPQNQINQTQVLETYLKGDLVYPK
ncbi:amidohydrolase [Candidatus Albibeggiatoa sp. nov. NOAA]|uniref:amidohydrolase n=1 Tax=Candidatus Albibeggiatoa sp. nov. NOAA TaxID=3162724 RepID=UPI0032F56181|nr:amidohydrolase [Thiotrichaceae bacterium]